MAGVVVYRGVVAGVNSREYSFADKNTGEKIEGVSHRLFLVTDDQDEPVMELRATDEIAANASKLRGKTVEVGAEPRARPMAGGSAQIVWHALYLNGPES